MVDYFFLVLFERPKRQEVEKHYWGAAQFAGYQATVSYWMSKGTEEGSAVRQGLWSTIQAKRRKCLFHITCSPVLFRIGVPSSSSNLIDPFQSKIVKDVISGSLLPTILFLVEDQVGVGVCWHSCTVCFALDRVLAGIHIPSLPSLAFLTPPPLPPY